MKSLVPLVLLPKLKNLLPQLLPQLGRKSPLSLGIDQGTDVQTAHRRMSEVRGPRSVIFDERAKITHELGQDRGVDREILDERDRFPSSWNSVEQRLTSFAKVPRGGRNGGWTESPRYCASL